jgi:hypothetical protein
MFDDNTLSRSLMRTHEPTFTADSSFPEFIRDYINYLRAINPAFPELLEEAAPPDAAVNTAYQNFQKNCWGIFA